MRIDIRIILAILSNECFSLVLRTRKERFFCLKDLLLDILRRVNVEHAWKHDKQKLLVESLRRWKTDCLETGINAPLHLVLESVFIVFDN